MGFQRTLSLGLGAPKKVTEAYQKLQQGSRQLIAALLKHHLDCSGKCGELTRAKSGHGPAKGCRAAEGGNTPDAGRFNTSRARYLYGERVKDTS